MKLVHGLDEILKITNTWYNKSCPKFPSMFINAFSVMLSMLNLSLDPIHFNHKYNGADTIAINYIAKFTMGCKLTPYELNYINLILSMYEASSVYHIDNSNLERLKFHKYFSVIHQMSSTNYMASAIFSVYLINQKDAGTINSITEWMKYPFIYTNYKNRSTPYSFYSSIGAPFTSHSSLKKYKSNDFAIILNKYARNSRNISARLTDLIKLPHYDFLVYLMCIYNAYEYNMPHNEICHNIAKDIIDKYDIQPDYTAIKKIINGKLYKNINHGTHNNKGPKKLPKFRKNDIYHTICTTILKFGEILNNESYYII